MTRSRFLRGAAALTDSAAGARDAALAGGLGAAITRLVLTGARLAWISSRERIGLLQPVSRGAGEPVPQAVPF